MLLFVFYLGLRSDLTAIRQMQSVYAEPAKKDISPTNFETFVEDRYDKQLLEFLNKYDESLDIPSGFVWNPLKVNQSRNSDKYMQMERVLFAICCIHHYYHGKVQLNIYDLVRNILCFGQVPIKSNVNLSQKIEARVIKYLSIANGAGNAAQVTKKDFGWTKPIFNGKHYNRYGRIVAVKYVCQRVIC